MSDVISGQSAQRGSRRMTLLGTRFRYGPIAQAFHWVMTVLVIATLLTALAADHADPSILMLHQALGVTVFVMVILRLAWRALFDRLPGKPPKQAASARWSWRVDVVLYVLLFAVPVTGLIGAYEGQALLIDGPAAGGEHGILDLHRPLGILLFLTAGLHSALALFHHYVRRDNVLKMMLPGGGTA